ncbi:MAG: ABC transporter substrate-binding protein [Anaerolineae bacterium]|nr:ABC transporter substrate-binding protein [Thermoflexales bacterium]MDW8054758.1 ABC transporter substrate-binding protein [Anaerolineae bacterium]MDW8292533.1 ABC transporter substrate-binding protein [Anaerolineae bacterium]
MSNKTIRPSSLILALSLALAACAVPQATPAPQQPAPQQPTEQPPAAQPTPQPPAEQPTQPPQAANVLVVGLPKADTRTLDPHRQYEITPPQIMRATYETLVTLPDKGKTIDRVEPLLAESFEVSEDALVYTFKLRSDVKFASGNPLTAEDVVFSFKRLGNLQDNPAWLFNDHVASIEAADERTVKITLKEPNAAFLAMLVSPNFAVVDSKVVREKGGTDADNAKEADKATDWLDSNSAGTGPYILKEWKRGEQVVLERNPNYWRGNVPFDRIIFREIPDDAARQQALERGDIDIAVGLDVDAIKRLQGNADFQIIVGNTLDMTYLALTTNAELSKPLADKRVRQAIKFAIDYDGIINGLLGGTALQLPTIIPLGLLGTDPALAPKRDVEKARALLKEAGYENGFELTMVYPGERKLSNVILADTLVAKLQEDLAEVGIKLNLEPRDATTWRADYRGGKLAATVADWTPDFLDPHGWAPAFAVEGASAAKRVYYVNKEAEKLALDAAKTTDAAKRAEMYRKVQEIILDDAVFIGLIQPKVQIVASAKLKDVIYNPVYFLDYYFMSR